MMPTPEQRQSLGDLALSVNEKLENAGQSAANQAFNLGCSSSLIPGLIIVLIVFIASRSNWIALGIAVTIILLGVIGFANFAAYRARTNTFDRTFQRDINPEIERTVRKMEVERTSFDQAAHEQLPQGAILRRYLPPPSPAVEDASEPG